MQKSVPAFSWVGFMDPAGKVLAGTNGILNGVNIAKRPVFFNGIQGEYIGDVHDAVLLAKLLPNPTGEPMKFVDISVPVKNEQDVLTGVLAAHLSWSWVSEVEKSMFDPQKDRKRQEVFIVSRTDNAVLLGPQEMLGQPLQLASIKLAQQGGNSWKVERWPDGREYLTGYASGKGYLNYDGLNWTVLVRQPIEMAYEPVKKLQIFIWVIGGLFSAAFAFAGWLMAGSIAKPLRDIAKAADRLRFGEKVVIPENKSIRDVEILSSSLRELIGSLTQKEDELGRMQVLAHHDKLTGLPNRIGLDGFFQNARKLIVEKNRQIAVLYLDLDGFKGINDNLGHHMGDLLLKEVANRLTCCIRSDAFAARIGGDEFVVAIPLSREEALAVATAIANRIISIINQVFEVEGHCMKVGCSVGCSFWKDAGKDYKEIVNQADEALYSAKRSGKNQLKIG